MIDIDAAACKKAGLSPNDILTTLQGYGGSYSSNFNRFGKLYRVMIRADPDTAPTLNPWNPSRCATEMKWHHHQFMRLNVSTDRIISSDSICLLLCWLSTVPRWRLQFRASYPSNARSSSRIVAYRYGYEFSGMTREEQSSSGSSTAMIFVLFCFRISLVERSMKVIFYLWPYCFLFRSVWQVASFLPIWWDWRNIILILSSYQ